MPRQLVRVWSALNRHPEKGFTLIEVLVAFTVLVLLITGMTMALTSSMRLGTVQKQRNVAQDIVRSVISRYLRNEDYNAIIGVPAFNRNFSATTYNNPASLDLYRIDNGVLISDNLANYNLTNLRGDLGQLNNPYLKLTISPIKLDATNYYTTKVNVLVNLTWKDHSLPRSIELPVVVGKGDVTRAPRGVFASPTAPAWATVPTADPTPTPTPSPTPTPTPYCLPNGTLCGSHSTCLSDCCSHNVTSGSPKTCIP